MATRVRTRAEKLYEQDFYVWTEVQAGLLRERRFEALDLANLIEEVEGLGDAKKSAVLNNASVIIEHLLKLQHSPASGPRAGWVEFDPRAPQPARVRPDAAPSPDPPGGAGAGVLGRPPDRRAELPRARGRYCGRRPAGDLPLQPRAGHR